MQFRFLEINDPQKKKDAVLIYGGRDNDRITSPSGTNLSRQVGNRRRKTMQEARIKLTRNTKQRASLAESVRRQGTGRGSA